MRYRIRINLLTLLEKQFQPAVVEHLASLANLAREDEAFLDALLEQRMAAAVPEREGEVHLALADLLAARAKNGFSTGCRESTEYSETTDGSDARGKSM